MGPLNLLPNSSYYDCYSYNYAHEQNTSHNHLVISHKMYRSAFWYEVGAVHNAQCMQSHWHTQRETAAAFPFTLLLLLFFLLNYYRWLTSITKFYIFTCTSNIWKNVNKMITKGIIAEWLRRWKDVNDNKHHSPLGYIVIVLQFFFCNSFISSFKHFYIY